MVHHVYGMEVVEDLEMKIEMSESLVASWLKHVKHCIVVNTNWKASPYWTPATTDARIGQICDLAAGYFNERRLRILDTANEQDEVARREIEDDADLDTVDWQNMLLQTECDAVGLAYSENQGGTLVYAVESAFHRNKIQYSKQRRSWKRLHLQGNTVTAWNVALKMFKNALSMFRWYGVRNAHIVFVAPMSSVPVEREILSACSIVEDFYQQQGFNFDFEFYFEHPTPGSDGTFSENVKNPVNLAATIVDDTSELYLRGHILDEGTESIDVLMLDKARRLLACENLDEMTGLHLTTSADLVKAIDRIKPLVVTANPENRQLYQRQTSRFDRCHHALRAYYATLHRLENVPTLQQLRRNGLQQRVEGVGVLVADADGVNRQVPVEIVLNPANPGLFKQRLLEKHIARRMRVYADGRAPRVDEWRADSFTANSNLMGNIKSSAAYRNAGHDGVVRLEFSIVD